MVKRKRADNDTTRTWCNVCKIWIADNRAQRQQHESGSKHKAVLAKLVKDISHRNAAQRKLLPEKEPNASNVDKTGSAAGTKTKSQQATDQRTAAQQLMDTAVSGMWCAQSVASARLKDSEETPDTLTKRDNGDLAVVSDDVHDVNDETQQRSVTVVAAALATEQVDENGFPLPASSVFGAWTSVGGDRNSVQETEGSEGVAHEEDAVKSEGHIFKKRRAASTKRKRRT